MKKVAFFADILKENHDGAIRTMFQIIDRIPPEEYEFLFITGRKPHGEFQFQIIEVPNVSIPFNKNYSLAIPGLSAFALRRKLDQFQPDIIHVASPSILGNFAVDYGRDRDLPIVTIYHTHFISYVPYYTHHLPVITDITKSLVTAGQRRFYNKCDVILVPTMTILHELSAYGFDSSKMLCWPRGINHDIFNPNKKNVEYIHSLTGNAQPTLLFASRLVWEKNLDLLVRLYEKFALRNTPVNFVIAGDGVAREELERRMPNALFLGKLSHEKLSVLYASSDVFVFPSISETYGNVVIEAMASGCPCVIADGGGSKSFIKQGLNGFLANPDCDEDFYRKIMILIKNPMVKKQIIDAGIRYVKDFDWGKLVDSYFDVLDQLTLKRIAS